MTAAAICKHVYPDGVCQVDQYAHDAIKSHAFEAPTVPPANYVVTNGNAVWITETGALLFAVLDRDGRPQWGDEGSTGEVDSFAMDEISYANLRDAAALTTVVEVG